MTLKWWNDNKMWLAPFAALIMWTVSMFCFIFGLSFKNPTGVVIGKLDAAMWVAIFLSVANTIIQLIGNGKKVEEMDFVFKVGWYSSYALGISSNVNFLLGILGMNNPFLEWVVSISLGAMVEIMPEKLVIMWLKSLNSKPNDQPQKYIPQHKPNNPMPNFRPANNQPKPRQNQPFPPKTTPMPTYHPIVMQGRPEMEDTDKDF